jgi:hypothetical protein
MHRLSAAWCFSLLLSGLALAGERYALVIGIDGYYRLGPLTTRSSIVFTCVWPAHDRRIAEKPPLAVPDGVQGHDPRYRATKTMSNKHCSW